MNWVPGSSPSLSGVKRWVTSGTPIWGREKRTRWTPAGHSLETVPPLNSPYYLWNIAVSLSLRWGQGSYYCLHFFISKYQRLFSPLENCKGLIAHKVQKVSSTHARCGVKLRVVPTSVTQQQCPLLCTHLPPLSDRAERERRLKLLFSISMYKIALLQKSALRMIYGLSVCLDACACTHTHTHTPSERK